MRLHHHGTSRRQRRSRIASRNRKCQRKIARPKHRHRSQRSRHRAYIRLGQRLARRIRLIDPRIHPRAFFHHLRKQRQLIRRSRKLSLQARQRQPRLQIRSLHNRRALLCQPRRNPAQKRATLSARGPGECEERSACQLDRFIDLLFGSRIKHRLHLLSRCRIHTMKRRLARRRHSVPNQGNSRQGDLNC